jgi:hypothetical protein
MTEMESLRHVQVNHVNKGVVNNAIADGGSNAILFPQNYPGLTEVKPNKQKASMADGSSTLEIEGTAKYGNFNVYIANVRRPIFSECSMVLPPFNLKIFKEYRQMFIYTSDSNNKTTIVTTATLSHNDNLYHLDDIEDLLNYQLPLQVNLNVLDHPNMTDKQYRQGSQRHTYKAMIANLNPLEHLHVILNHASEKLIKFIVKENLIKGLRYTYNDIRHLHLPLCDTCMRCRMKAFPVYPSLVLHVYAPMEMLSCDILDFKACPDIGGYRFVALYADRSTGCPFPYFLKRKVELLETLKKIQREHGLNRNPKAVRLRFLNADSGSEQLEEEFVKYCDFHDIQLLLAPPKKPEYDYIESLVGGVKAGTRMALDYASAPMVFWRYAMSYHCQTYRNLPKYGSKVSRITLFNGTIPDFSHAVPFYSKGYSNITKDESATGILPAKAIACRMLGYANNIQPEDTPQLSQNAPGGLVSYKQSYIIRLATGLILVRHDCYFGVYSTPTLLHTDPPNDVKHSINDENHKKVLLSPENVPDLQPVRTRLQQLQLDLQRQQLELQAMAQEDTLSATHKAFVDATTYSESDDLPYWHPASNLAISCNTVRIRTYVDLGLPTIHEMEATPPETAEWVDQQPTIQEPRFNPEAINSPEGKHWRSAIVRETTKVLSRKAWAYYTLEEQHRRLPKAVRSKYAFKCKTRSEDTMRRYKARLTAKGYTQIFGHNYEETYAPTARFESVCILLFLACVFDWNLEGLDVENAFIEGELKENIDMVLPKDCYRNNDGSPIVVRLLKAIYGLKQASHVFHLKLKAALILIDVHPTIHDPCVFIHRDETHNLVTLAAMWVDDIVVTGNNPAMRQKIISTLSEVFTKITHEGEIHRYIGVDILRDRVTRSMTLCQPSYKATLRDKYLLPNAKTKKNPVNSISDLRTGGDGSIAAIHEQAGELGYLADRTAPDIKYAVSNFRSNAANPSDEHIKALKHIMRYLADDIQSGITFNRGNTDEVLLFAVTDGSKIRGGDSHGQMAFALFLNLHSGAICARTMKNKRITTSPAEEEAYSVVHCVKRVIWCRGLLSELGFNQDAPTKIYTDSTAVIDMVKSVKNTTNVEHMLLAINYLRQQVEMGIIELCHVDTANNVADIMTKNLAQDKFVPLKSKLNTGHAGIAPQSSLPTRRVKLPNAFTKMHATMRKAKKPNQSTRFQDINDDSDNSY